MRSRGLISQLRAGRALLAGNSPADRLVPPGGLAARLMPLTGAVMAFLAVFALALGIASDRLANRWAGALERTATVRISAPGNEAAAQAAIALDVLATTPGIKDARALDETERRALLAPWFGPGMSLDAQSLPEMIEVETEAGLDVEGLRTRLAGEAPGATLDDHHQWREPLDQAAGRLRLLARLSLGLIVLTAGAMILLAARAALAANHRVIVTLRLIGARDAYVIRAFARRYAVRTLTGAAIGTAAGMIGLALLPDTGDGGYLAGPGIGSAVWLMPVIIPPLMALAAFAATRHAARRQLRKTT